MTCERCRCGTCGEDLPVGQCGRPGPLPVPLIVLSDRYGGVYSRAKFTAWNCYFEDFPVEAEGDDTSADVFWCSHRDGYYDETICDLLTGRRKPIGLGDTPDAAVEDLRRKLAESEDGS